MQEAESLKDKGNTAFMGGKDQEAIAYYLEAIAALETTVSNGLDAASQPFKDLKRNLYSNLSNVHLHLCQYGECCAAAADALTIDSTFVKASLRYVRAKMLAGYPFDAFVYALRYTRPLVREMQAADAASATTKDAVRALQEVEAKLSTVLAISKLSPGFELVDYQGGVDMVSRQRFSAGDVLFAEEKYETRFDEGGIEDGCGSSAGTTTEDIVLRFAQHIRPEQKAQSKEWLKFRRDFVGAWPRAVGDVDEFTRSHVGEFVRPHFSDLDDRTYDELLLTSLMCRYNCFYTGFFRTCALANHSCLANIAMKYNPATSTVTMVAVADIEPGELMDVKYLNDAHFLLGVGKRRELLRAWLFWCRCSRCADDNDPGTAVQEFVGCVGCGRFSHYAIPVPPCPDFEDDPGLDTSPPCYHCGASMAFSAEKLQRFYHIADSPTGDPAAQALGRWLVWRLSEVRALGLHPAHWINRVLFYLFCLSVNGVIARHFAAMLHAQTAAAREEEARDLLAPFGLKQAYAGALEKLAADPTTYDPPRTASGQSAHERNAGYHSAGVVWDTVLVRGSCTPPHGCDTLRALVILCGLIAPFYPNSEMWAVHKMICECVLLQLLFQRALRIPEDNYITQAQALLLLQAHGPCLGEQAASRWIHSLTLFKATISKEDERELPTVAALKKAFKPKGADS